MDDHSEVNRSVSLYSFYPFRRIDDSLEFYNNTWQQYKAGFNDGLDRNLWLGNDRIHVMSTRVNVILRVEINGNRDPNHENPNIYLYGKYYFSVNTMLIKIEVSKI